LFLRFGWLTELPHEIGNEGRERLLALLLGNGASDVSRDGGGSPTPHRDPHLLELLGRKRDGDLGRSHTPIIPIAGTTATPNRAMLALMTVTVREASADDHAAVEAIDRAATADLRKVYRPTVAAERERAALGALMTLVASISGQVVGVVRYRIGDERISAIGLGVDPGFRRRGVARALIRRIEEIGARTGCRVLSVYTVRQTGNVPIFERMGLAVQAEGPSELFESDSYPEVIEVLMTKDLVAR
jgi:GNAT superfamily N-acetyltransferase